MEEIILDISDDGEIAIETKGFKGKSCIKTSQFLKDILGKEIERQLTPAYYDYNPEDNVQTKKHLNLCG